VQPHDFSPDRAVREPERAKLTGLPTSTWYELQAAGLAPRPFPLSAKTVAWSFNELTEWIEARKAQRVRERDAKAAQS
jgi:prophage regulatory protein